MNDGKYITVNQAMEIFHLGRRTVRKRMDEIGATVKMGKRVLFDTDIIKEKYGDFKPKKTIEDRINEIGPFLAAYICHSLNVDGDEVQMNLIIDMLQTKCTSASDCYAVIDTLIWYFHSTGESPNFWDFIKNLDEVLSNGR